MDIHDCTHATLKFDEACVNLRSNDNATNLWLYSLSSDCVSCPYTRIAPISGELHSNVKFSTVRGMSWRVLNTDMPITHIPAQNTSDIVCSLSPNLVQYSEYELWVDVENQNCDLRTSTASTSPNPYAELFIILGVLIAFLLGLSGLKSLWNACRKKCIKPDLSETATKEPTKRRVRAIDTFRGVSTLLMIFVNGGAGGYPMLIHATWNGLLIGDLVFPCFIWIMGVCIPIALSSQIKRMVPMHVITYSIIKRSILLFLFGVALNTVGSGPQLETLRIFGVLQRFGVTYLIAGLTYLYLIPKKMKKIESPVLRHIQDLWILLPQWFIMITIVIIHCILTFALAVPGCPTGYLGPGGLHDDGKYFTCVGGATGYIDRVILSEMHIYQRPLTNKVYGSGAFDPEGILGCLTSTFQVFLGVQAGVIMMSYKDWKERVIRWLLWAVVFGCIGSALHFCNVIPVNKNLWSLSFVFVSTSFALAFLSGCYLLVDVVKVWRGGPFRVPGMNALLLYVGHILCYRVFPFHWRIGEMDSRALRLVETIWGMGLWTIIAYIMHRKRTYISL